MRCDRKTWTPWRYGRRFEVPTVVGFVGGDGCNEGRIFWDFCLKNVLKKCVAIL